MLKIGIIREGKVPPDARVPLNPSHCALAHKEFPVNILVQPSAGRCFADEEYQQVIESLIERKNRELSTEKNPQIKKQKLMRFLLSRGFQYDEFSSLNLD